MASVFSLGLLPHQRMRLANHRCQKHPTSHWQRVPHVMMVLCVPMPINATAPACAPGPQLPAKNSTETCGVQRSCNGTASCTETFPTSNTLCDDAQVCTHTDACNGQGECVGVSYSCQIRARNVLRRPTHSVSVGRAWFLATKVVSAPRIEPEAPDGCEISPIEGTLACRSRLLLALNQMAFSIVGVTLIQISARLNHASSKSMPTTGDFAD